MGTKKDIAKVIESMITEEVVKAVLKGGKKYSKAIKDGKLWKLKAPQILPKSPLPELDWSDVVKRSSRRGR